MLLFVCSVGQPNFDESTHTPPNLSCLPKIHRFSDLKACRSFLTSRCARLYGVEIVEGATNVELASFRNADGTPHRCAFMMGNEGAGMNAPQLAACDEFLKIPQYGVGTASLNVSNAAAVVLQYFALSRDGAQMSKERFHEGL